MDGSIKQECVHTLLAILPKSLIISDNVLEFIIKIEKEYAHMVFLIHPMVEETE